MAHSKSKATTWLGIPVLIATLWSLAAPAVAEDTPIRLGDMAQSLNGVASQVMIDQEFDHIAIQAATRLPAFLEREILDPPERALASGQGGIDRGAAVHRAEQDTIPVGIDKLRGIKGEHRLLPSAVRSCVQEIPDPFP